MKSRWNSSVASRRAFCALVACGLVGGCAHWREDTPDGENGPDLNPGGLPEGRVSSEAAILDLAFLPVSPKLQIDTAAVSPWSRMDETVVAPETREILASNGLRAGRLNGFELDELEQSPTENESTRLLREANLLSDFESRRQRLSHVPNQPYTLAVRQKSQGEKAVLVRQANGQVEGRRMEDPQFTFQMRTFTLDDGRMSVRLIPEIQYGQIKQNFVTSQALAFRWEFRRDSWMLSDLTIDIPLSTGQAVVILPTDEPFGLGAQMLVGRRADTAEERIAVVIHLSRLPQDPLNE